MFVSRLEDQDKGRYSDERMSRMLSNKLMLHRYVDQKNSKGNTGAYTMQQD